MTAEAAADGSLVHDVAARLVFVDGTTGPARARVIERSAQWRRAAAARQLLWWLLAPVVVFAPPHIPWVILVLAVGGFRASEKLREARTLTALHGTCPKCGAEQDFSELGRLKHPHKVQCVHCRWELRAEVAAATDE